MTAENNNVAYQPDPAMLALRESLRSTLIHEDKRVNGVDRVRRALDAYADERGTSRPEVVKWGLWNSAFQDDGTDVDVVVGFALSDDLPEVVQRGHFGPYYQPRVSREVSGFRDDLDFLANTAIDWGKTIIDRVADCSYLLPATFPGGMPANYPRDLSQWCEQNCMGPYAVEELDLNPKPHVGLGFSNEKDICADMVGICLTFEEEADRVLFRLRWLC